MKVIVDNKIPYIEGVIEKIYSPKEVKTKTHGEQILKAIS